MRPALRSTGSPVHAAVRPAASLHVLNVHVFPALALQMCSPSSASRMWASAPPPSSSCWACSCPPSRSPGEAYVRLAGLLLGFTNPLPPAHVRLHAHWVRRVLGCWEWQSELLPPCWPCWGLPSRSAGKHSTGDCPPGRPDAVRQQALPTCTLNLVTEAAEALPAPHQLQLRCICPPDGGDAVRQQERPPRHHHDGGRLLCCGLDVPAVPHLLHSGAQYGGHPLHCVWGTMCMSWGGSGSWAWMGHPLHCARVGGLHLYSQTWNHASTCWPHEATLASSKRPPGFLCAGTEPNDTSAFPSCCTVRQDPANLFSSDSVTGGTYATAQVHCHWQTLCAALFCSAGLDGKWAGLAWTGPAAPCCSAWLLHCRLARLAAALLAPSPCPSLSTLAHPFHSALFVSQVIWDAFAARYGDGKRSIALVRCRWDDPGRTGWLAGWLAGWPDGGRESGRAGCSEVVTNSPFQLCRWWSPWWASSSAAWPPSPPTAGESLHTDGLYDQPAAAAVAAAAAAAARCCCCPPPTACALLPPRLRVSPAPPSLPLPSLSTLRSMLYAFSRDGAVPGHRWWHHLNPRTKTPVNAVWLS